MILLRRLNHDDIKSLGWVEFDSRYIRGSKIDVTLFRLQGEGKQYYVLVKDNNSDHVEITIRFQNSKAMLNKAKLDVLSKSELKVLMRQCAIKKI